MDRATLTSLSLFFLSFSSRVYAQNSTSNSTSSSTSTSPTSSASPSGFNSSYDPFDYINPLIGTENGGHVFPGASLPFSMAKAGPDATSDNEGGFASDGGTVNGFSHMHDSGTGGSPSLGNFAIWPQAGCPGDQLDRCNWPKDDRSTTWIDSSVKASPGYFAIELNSTISAEITVTNHTALYSFVFPNTVVPPYNSSQDVYPNITSANQTIPPVPAEDQGPVSPLILMDLTDLPDTRINGSATVDPDTGRIGASGTFQPSFGIGTYDVHACIDFSGLELRRTGVFINNRAGEEPKNISVVADGVDTSPGILPAGAWAQFNSSANNTLIVRVGVSFISVDQACANAEKEIPDFDFNKTLSAAQDAWHDKLGVLSIDPTGVNDSIQTIFWSGLYRSMLSPQDYTGENPLWNSTEPYYDSYYCIWDSSRSIHPLITLVDPVSQTQMIRSLIDIYRHEGWLPDCRMSLCKGFTQGGSNADIVLADSYLKNISQDVDWATGYAAVVQDAEVEPSLWSIQGRGGLTSWKNLGYIPTDDYDPYGVGPFTRSISRTVEYAYDDFCISEMAKAMGNTADYTKYTQRSLNWKNMFLSTQTSSINGNSTGFTGFLQPRYLNGTYGFQDPIFCSPLLDFTSCYLDQDGHETYEGSAFLYTFYAPHDMADLITTLGGAQDFVNRLQFFHTSGLLYIGDEQAFLMVYLFHYAARPALSSYFAHYYIPSQFNDTLVGIPGNDDSGAMGSFSTLSMMGIWPISGQDVYLIIPPFFPCVNLTSGQTGNTATIRNVNFDANYENIYIQNATLNGQPYTKNWISHSFFLDGGVLELTLGPKESSWGTAAADLPPSLSMGNMTNIAHMMH